MPYFVLIITTVHIFSLLVHVVKIKSKCHMYDKGMGTPLHTPSDIVPNV